MERSAAHLKSQLLADRARDKQSWRSVVVSEFSIDENVAQLEGGHNADYEASYARGIFLASEHDHGSPQVNSDQLLPLTIVK